MKLIFKISLLLLIPFIYISCDDMNKRVLPSCTGKSGDLLVVVDSFYYNHLTGSAIKAVFGQEQKGLPQRETLFSVIQVPHRSFARIFETTRNIIMINIEPKSKIKLTVTKDVWAESQLVVTITAPSDNIAAETITKNANALLTYFNDKEIERLQAKYMIFKHTKNTQHLKEKFKLEINIDEFYVIAKDTNDFIWLRREKSVGGHQVSQGIMIYTYPYTNDSTFNIANLVEKRDYYTKAYVAGSFENSYMMVYNDYEPVQKEISLNGVYMNELRGLWQMQGDFMGGPFINYSMVDEQRNRVICIDGYVYAPEFDKREYLRELEALIKTVTF